MPLFIHLFEANANFRTPYDIICRMCFSQACTQYLYNNGLIHMKFISIMNGTHRSHAQTYSVDEDEREQA